MTIDRFIQSLQRFTGRRQFSHITYGDNAQTFHSVNCELTDLWTSISSIRCLRKVVGHVCIDEEELRTVFTSIEVALNSRPLTQDEANGYVLTPAHFLVVGKAHFTSNRTRTIREISPENFQKASANGRRRMETLEQRIYSASPDLPSSAHNQRKRQAFEL